MKLMTPELLAEFAKHGEQDGKGDNAIVVAHYFNPFGAGDWFAISYEPQDNCIFCYASLFNDHNNEYGYTSLDELEQNNIELDLHWTPCTIREACKKKNIYFS